MSTLLQREASKVTEAVHAIASSAEYDELIAQAAAAQFVLIGEASHGTHEFYATRAELTQRLIAEHGFRIVALEADWPDTLRVHRYVTGRAEERDAPKPSAIFAGSRRGCGAIPS